MNFKTCRSQGRSFKTIAIGIVIEYIKDIIWTTGHPWHSFKDLFLSSFVTDEVFEPEGLYMLIKKSIPYHVDIIVTIMWKKFYLVCLITERKNCDHNPVLKSVTFCKTLVIIIFMHILMVVIS